MQTGPAISVIQTLNSRFTSLPGMTQTSQSGAQILTSNSALMSQQLPLDRDASFRFGNAILGSSRGRPRGRRPLRGQFPVVPIDMVRQLGIEQQVILQPAAPVAMRNKSTLCRPLSLSRRTQVNCVNQDFQSQTDGETLCDISYELSPRRESPRKIEKSPTKMPKFLPIPVPVPIYVPVPVYVQAKPVPFAFPMPIPLPLPLGLMLEGPEEGKKFNESVCSAEEQAAGCSRRSGRSTSPQKPSSPEPQAGQKRPLSRTSIAETSGTAPTAAKRSKIPTIQVSAESEKNFHLKYSYGIHAWCHWLKQKLTGNNATDYEDLRTELHQMTEIQLNTALTQFVQEVRKPNKDPYVADSVFYLCLGIQQYLSLKGVKINIFGSSAFSTFVEALDDILANFQPRISPEGLLICRIEEEHLWEAKQLGSELPQVLLFSIIYFITKNIGLRTVAQHKKINFSNFKITNQDELVFTPPKSLLQTIEIPIEKITWEPNVTEPSKCLVKLFKIYQLHCPSSVVSKGETLYYQVGRQSAESSSSSSQDWFTTSVLSKDDIKHMLNRIKMVKEIQEAFMNSQSEQSYF